MNIPELELDDEEAMKLEKSLAKLMKFYPMGISEKKLAWAEFISTAATVYGTRAIAITRRNAKKEMSPGGKPQIVSNAKPQAAATAPPDKPARETVATNPSQIWNEGGGHEGEIREG